MNTKFSLDPYLVLYQVQDFLSKWPYLKVALILVTIFAFVLLMAYVRVHIFKISMQGALFGFVLGVAAVILFDIIVISAFSDKEKIRAIFSDGKPKEAVSEVVFSGVSNINQILGATTTVVTKKQKSATEVMGEILNMNSNESEKIKNLLCPTQ